MKTKKKFLLVLVLLGLAGLAFGLAWTGHLLQRPLALEEDYVLQVPGGSSFSGVLFQLQEDGLLGESGESRQRRLAGRLFALVSPVDETMHIGEYRLQPGMSLHDFLGKLERGEVLQRSLTLVEGWNIRELRRRLNSADGLRHETAGLSARALMDALERPERHPEGWFAPDTYFYVRGDSDLDLLRRALMRQEQLLEDAWRDRAADLPYEEPYEALIMASIVEKETAVAHERDEIAGVFVERLRRGMRLQTDPTVIYGMGESYTGNITRADLQRDTPYNTYRRPGLPPTPIAMPGAAAIRAALNPADTEALYFVARGDGTHHFSATHEEHQKAVREYQLRRRDDYRSTPAADAEPAPAEEAAE